MSLIQSAITQRGFERVRDRIAEILATELPQQATLNSLTYLNSTVAVERMIPIHPAELTTSFINVRLANGNYNNYKLLDKDGNYTFFVDCYMKGYSTNDDRGDNLAQTKLQRLTGVVDAIISDSKYITLGWAKPSVSRVEVTEISVQDYSEFKNAENMVMARLVVEVRIQETVEAFNPPPIDKWTTQVYLQLTEQGYIFSGDAPVIPPPPECDPATYQNTNGSFVQNIASGGTYIAPDINITLNGLGFLSVVANTDQDIVLKNTTGDVITPSGISGNEVIIDQTQPAPDATVENSDQTYTDTVSAGDTLVTPDVEISINSVSQGTFPSVKDLDIPFVCPTPDVNTAEIIRSGQVTSYATNDDGALQFGRDTSFTQLAYNNVFGNKNRFTDELGGQTYANKIYIDHSTYDVPNGLIQGFIIGSQQGQAVTSWNNAIAGQPYTFHGYNDWYMVNRSQAEYLSNWGVNSMLEYAPFNFPIVNAATILWTSTTVFSPTTNAWYMGNTRGFLKGLKTANAGLFLFRFFTLAELGV